MKIARIRLFAAPLPIKGGPWRWGKGFEMHAGTAHVVALDSDTGLTGWGESAPMVAFYLPAHDKGIPAVVAELAPHLLGLDPRNPAAVDAEMDRWLHGHAYAKSAIDVACWDLAGRALGVPCHLLLGGRRLDAMPIFRTIPQPPHDDLDARLADFRAQCFRYFQMKVGGDPSAEAARVRSVAALLRPEESLIADANRGWRRDQALRFAHETRDLSLTFEQPCDSYDDCLSVRRRTSHVLKLDEAIKTADDLFRAIADDACDTVCVKIAKQGGLTKARLIRDICAARGLPMTVEDVWGGEIASAAVAHLAASTPPDMLLNTTDLQNYNDGEIATGAPTVADGCLIVSDRPGLGIEPVMAALGDPVAVYE